MNKNISIIAFVTVLIFLTWKTITLSNELSATKAELAIAQQEIESISNKDALSEWDVFTLALMKVESNYELAAVSSVGAKGYFQIMPIYVEEVNLPDRIEIPFYVSDDEIADMLSDEYGFCVLGFNIEQVEVEQ